MGRRGNGDQIPEARSAIAGDISGVAVQAGAVHGEVHVYAAPVPESEPPRQLPLPVPAFTGRERELAELERAATGGGEQATAQIVVLSGAGGVGKSALATEAALRHTPSTSDGQLYSDLRAYSADGPADVSDVLAHFLTALGFPPDRLPAGAAARAAVYRSVTAGRQHTILLDDAATAAQVRALLPGPGGHLVLVTSRHRLAGLRLDGARFVQVGPLSDANAAALLTRLTDPPATDAALVTKTARLCGGLPLAVVAAAVGVQLGGEGALQWVAADLEQRSARLTALSPDEEGESSVRTTFDASYDALPESAQRLYRRLGWFPGGEIDRYSAAILLDCTPQEARGPLRVLTSCSLLREQTPGRYRIHDLLHLHARERAEQVEPHQRTQVVTRLCAHHAEHALAADRKLRSYTGRYSAAADQPAPFDGQDAALDWLLRERGALIALADEARELGLHHDALDITEGLWPLFLRRSDTDAWLRASQPALAAARTAGDPRACARLIGRNGLVHSSLGDREAAQLELAEAEALWRSVGDTGRVAQALQHRGIAAVEGGAPEEALAPLTQSLELDDRPGREHNRAVTLLFLGTARAACGLADGAESALEEAVALFREPFDALNTYTACTELAALLSDRDPARARSELQAAHGAAVAARDTGRTGASLLALGAFDLNAGDPQSASEALTQAAELLSETNDDERAGRARALAEMAEQATQRGAPDGPTGPAPPPPDESGPGPGAAPH